MSELSKKIKVIAQVAFLQTQDFINNIKQKAQGLITNLAKFPSIDPAPASVLTKANAMQTLVDNRAALLLQAEQLTKDIKAARKDLNDIAVDHWCGQIQTDAAGDIGLIKAVNFGIKNEDDNPPAVSIGNSKPIITDTDINRHLEHSFTIKNNVTGLIGLPEDAQRCEVYESIGTTEPTDIKTMTYMGSSRRGKFTNHFLENQVGQYVWYCCVYVPKPSATGSVEISGKIKLIVT